MIDFSKNTFRDIWFRHPVLGDASFDTFERFYANPLHKGEHPYEWPVNCSLFRDPVSGNLYAYVSRYSRDYWDSPINCAAYRSQDNGESWESTGVVLKGTVDQFDCKDGKRGSAGDIAVIYADGAYHAIFGWVTHDNSEGGLAYAKSDSPEGPFIIHPVPVHHDAKQEILLGKYRRVYASKIIRRNNDWLVLAMMSTPHNNGGTWAFVSMTAANPEGPYSEPCFMMHPESRFHYPPILEFFPPFEEGGYIYAPFTSVALNRSFQAIYRAKRELAHLPAAWEIYKYGSVWHAENREYERQGIWGQTIAGNVEADGVFRVLFPSKTADDIGTISLASCRWGSIDSRDGFFLTAPNGKSITFIKRAYKEFRLYAEIESNNTKTVFWAYNAPLGPNSTSAGTTLHEFCLRDMVYLKIYRDRWKLGTVDAEGNGEIAGSGILPGGRPGKDILGITCGKEMTVIELNGTVIWQGLIPVRAGKIGLLAYQGDYLSVSAFRLDSEGEPCRLNYLCTEGLMGSGQHAQTVKPSDGWIKTSGDIYRYGTGYEADVKGSYFKWNYIGRDFALWSPKGPQFGRIRIFLDGGEQDVVSLQSETCEKSNVIYESKGVLYGYHAVFIEAPDGGAVCDSFEFTV